MKLLGITRQSLIENLAGTERAVSEKVRTGRFETDLAGSGYWSLHGRMVRPADVKELLSWFPAAPIK